MKLPLHVRILLGMAAGVPWALLSSFMGWSRFNLEWIDPFGKIFINLLKLVAVPLVLFSIISGVAGMGEVPRLGSLGLRTLGFFLLTAILASIGAAAIPSGGMMLMVVVLASLGLYPAWVAIVFTIDRPLDMLRTVVNVTGDAAVCSVVAHSQGEKLFTDKEKLQAA